MNSSGDVSVRTSSYTAKQLLVGHHFEESSIQFDKFRIRFPLLQDWLGLSGIKGLPTGDEFEVAYTSPEKISTNHGPWNLEFSVTQNHSFSFGDISLSEDAYLQIENREADLTLDQIGRQVTIWKNFVTLALDEEIFPTRVIGYTESVSGAEGRDIEIMSTAYRSGDMDRTYHPTKVNFDFSDIEQNVSEVLSNWLDQSDRFTSAYGLYFSVVYQSPMQIENQYLILSSALESFYQEKTEDPVGLAAENRLDEVLRAIVDEYKSVLSHLPWEPDEMLSKILEMRNSIIHGMNIDSSNSMTLYDQVLFLQALLETAFLTELGIPEEHTRERLNDKYTRQRPFVVTKNTDDTSES